jgi:MinD-like ATPase involved in chromosome partitioning or flagellar assembly
VSIPVLTAVADAGWEAALTLGLSRDDHGVQVIRRCVDLADLLAASAAGLARAVILSADLRRLDRDALARLGLARVAVVGLVAPGDEPAERRLRQLGVAHVLPHDAPAAEVSAAVLAAVGELARPPQTDPALGWSDPASALADLTSPDPADAPLDAAPGTGRVIAVWGPVGSPGRSTIAINLAAELAELGHPALLLDADTYGGAVAQLLGVLDEAPGVAAACRLANLGMLDVMRLAEIALEVRPGLRVLTGITRAERWLELRPAALGVVLGLARSLAAFSVVDCGFCLEQDEELAYDTAAPRRNGATLAVLEAADVVVSVAAADPVGLTRYVRARTDWAEVFPGPAALTVVNRVRRGVVGPGDPRRAVAAALERYAGISDIHAVPNDGDALDAAVSAGRTLAEVAPKSPAREAIRSLAAQIAGEPVERGRRPKKHRQQR